MKKLISNDIANIEKLFTLVSAAHKKYASRESDYFLLLEDALDKAIVL
jgi:hypothetical protein